MRLLRILRYITISNFRLTNAIRIYKIQKKHLAALPSIIHRCTGTHMESIAMVVIPLGCFSQQAFLWQSNTHGNYLSTFYYDLSGSVYCSVVLNLILVFGTGQYAQGSVFFFFFLTCYIKLSE